MDRVMPTIEELQEKLTKVADSRGFDHEYYIVQYVQVQAVLHICQELEAINNNLEALRSNEVPNYNALDSAMSILHDIVEKQERMANAKRYS